MAAAPSAATGATGLERLLLIFLMKLGESQNAVNNTYFSYDRFSDQSEKLRETVQETQEHREPPKKPATPPETTASPTDNQTSEGTQTPPNKSRVNNRKPHFTEQKSKRTAKNAKTPTNLKRTANYGCTSTQPHRKSRKPPRTHAADGNRFYTAPRWAPDDPAC